MAVSLRHSLEENWERSFKEAARHIDNPMPAHKIVGEIALGRVQENFKTQSNPTERWPDLSDATLLARARGRSGRGKVEYKRRRAGDGGRAVTPRAASLILSAKALIWSGRLLRSMTWQAARDVRRRRHQPGAGGAALLRQPRRRQAGDAGAQPARAGRERQARRSATRTRAGSSGR
jgi:hypothetical protein